MNVNDIANASRSVLVESVAQICNFVGTIPDRIANVVLAILRLIPLPDHPIWFLTGVLAMAVVAVVYVIPLLLLFILYGRYTGMLVAAIVVFQVVIPALTSA